MKGITKILIPVLLLAITAVLAQDADYALFLSDQGAGVPFLRVNPFVFGGPAYTIMAHGRVDQVGATRTLLHAYDDAVPSANDRSQVMITLDSNNRMVLQFGRDNERTTVTTSNHGITANVMFSLIVTVEAAGGNSVTVNVYVNNNRIFGSVVNGIAARGKRTMVVGATRHLQNPWDGVIDNVAIVNKVVSAAARASHVSTRAWSPSKGELFGSLALWLSFDDTLYQLEDTAIAVISVEGSEAEWVEGTVHNGGSFTPHVVSDQWVNCHGWGDPHIYSRTGAHIGGGEYQHGGHRYVGCTEQETEIRSYARYTMWWGATVYRAVAVRFQDYVWRVNLEERHSAPDDSRMGTPYARLGWAPGTFQKHISGAWQAIGDGTTIHPETGVRVEVSGGRARLRVSVPSTLVFWMDNNGRYMNLYVTVNKAVCTNLRGVCESEINLPASIDYVDWLPPPKLPDVPTPDPEPCTGLAANLVSTIDRRCTTIFPSDLALREWCKYDACSSGDPDIIPETEITSECALERMTKGTASSCSDTLKCSGNCGGRGTCEPTTGICTCEPGFCGDDCSQLCNFQCYTAGYGTVDMNIEPHMIFKQSADDMSDRFGDYTVFRSLFIDPVTYQGVDYLKFVASSPDSQYPGSARVCITANGADALPGAPVFVNQPPRVSSLKPISASGSWAGRTLCVDMSWPAFSTGGFYIQLVGAHDLTISVTNKNNLEQVLFGSKNGRGGVDVAKIPESEHNTISFVSSACDNSACTDNDGNCEACWRVPQCGFCMESQRCSLGRREGPRRGICRNWRFAMEDNVNRVVTTRFSGDDLVDPDYEVFLSSVTSSASVPVNVYVPTGRTNDNVDILFYFSTAGDYALYASNLKANLLDAIDTIGDYNLGIGYYGAVAAKTTLTMTRVQESTKYLFGRAMEAPRGIVSTAQGGQFNALSQVGTGASVGFRTHSRKLVAIVAYDTPVNEAELVATRTSVLKAGFLPIWLVPTNVDNTVAEYYQELSDRLTGIPAIVLRIDPAGKNFRSVFKNAVRLANSFPHVVITDPSAVQYTHVDMTALDATSDSLSIFGLSNTGFRARFLIPMKQGNPADTTHKLAHITIPGFGQSTIEDVDQQFAISYDISADGKENTPCLPIRLQSTTFVDFIKPFYNILTLPAKGSLKVYNKDGSAGADVTTGLTSSSVFCFVPVAYDYSYPATDLYASFTYAVNDGCLLSSPSTVSIKIHPVREAPIGADVMTTISEDDQIGGTPVLLTATGFEADRNFGTGNPELVSYTYYETKGFVANEIYNSQPADAFYVTSSGAVTAYDTAYPGFIPSGAPNFATAMGIEYRPTDENFFGQVRMQYKLTDETNMESNLYNIIVDVTPINDAPTLTADNDQFTLEDTPVKIQMTANDVDSFGIGIDIELVSMQGTGTLANPRGGNFVAGTPVNDVCVANAKSRTVSCDLTFTPGLNENSCVETNPALVGTNCPTPYAVIRVRVNDHNSIYPPNTEAVTAWETINIHVAAVNDKPERPADVVVELKEDQTDFIASLIATDIDSASGDLDIFLDELPKGLRLYQVDINGNRGAEILTPAELNDYNKKRQASRKHGVMIDTIPNEHGLGASFTIDAVDFHAWDGELKSEKAILTVNVKPINDAPVPTVLSFEQNEDSIDALNCVLELTATDVDNEESDLVYTITALPFLDTSAGEGIEIFQVVNGEKGDIIDAANTVIVKDNGVAKIWIQGLPDWYSVAGETLQYTVTDVDAFLPSTDADYVVNTATATLTIKVNPVNDAPLFNILEQPIGDEDTPIVVTLSGTNNYWGEQADVLNAEFMSFKTVSSDGTDTTGAGFYQYTDNLYNQLTVDSTDLTGAVAIGVSDTLTDAELRFIYVPPKHCNDQSNKRETPLFVSPSFSYRITETSTHENLPSLQSQTSDMIVIKVDPVNDKPVTWGSNAWDAVPAHDSFYGTEDDLSGSRPYWKEPAGDVCYETCQYDENFGADGFVSTLTPELIYFGGRDIEGNTLSVRIESVDCLPGAELFEVTTAGQVPVTSADLVGKTLGGNLPLPYRLNALLAFKPKINDWNLVNPAETRSTVDISGTERASGYCIIDYVVVDEEDLVSDPMTITIHVLAKNDQPLEVFNIPTQDAANSLTLAAATSSEIYGNEGEDLYIYLNATDVEGDDFTATIVNCGTRGEFFVPKTTQSSFVNRGIISSTAVFEDLFESVAINCATDLPFELSTKFKATGSEGWYILFRPVEGEIGVEYNEIKVEYDDNVVVGQAPSTTLRTINIRQFNNAPVISTGSFVVSGPTADQQGLFLTVSVDAENNFQIKIADDEAQVSTEISYTDFWFRIAVLSIPSEVTADMINELVPFEWMNTPVSEDVRVLEVQDADFSNGQFGYIQFSSSVGVANEVFQKLTLKTNYVGDYQFEIVALDNGRSGFCPDDLMTVDPTQVFDSEDIRTPSDVHPGREGRLVNGKETRCNREASAVITVQSVPSAAITATIATAAGAALLGLIAAAAVAAAKIAKPEDADGWNAITNADTTHMTSSPLYVGGTTTGTSQVYVPN